MASNVRAIIAAVKTRLALVNGSGSYVHDLSGNDRVKVGRPTPADGRYPCVWLAQGPLSSNHDADLTGYRREFVIDIEGRTTASSDSPEERGLIAADLLDDIVTALEGDRTLGGTVLDITVDGMAVDGDEVGVAGVALMVAQLHCWWLVSEAEGV